MENSIEKIRKGEITYDDILKENKEDFLAALDELIKTYNNSVKVEDSLRSKIIADELKGYLDKNIKEFDKEENLIAKEYIEALEKISGMDEDHIEWISSMDFFSEIFILQTELTLKKIRLCDKLKSKFIKELKKELEVYSTNKFNLDGEVEELEKGEEDD